MSKIISTKTTMQENIRKGIDDIATIVAATLGPGGLPIIIERAGQALNGDPLGPLITKDGVSVAEQCASSDPEMDVVIQSVKDICRKTNRVAGDGPQPLYSKVLTPTGFREMGTLLVGDAICGTNGTIQKVLGVFPKGRKEIFEIEFSDQRIVECCEEHLWNVTTNSGKNKTITTAEIMSDYVKEEKGHKRYKYYVPTTNVEMLDNLDEMPLDPYLVGLLLGDGSLTGTGSIELSLGLAKKHVLDKIKLPEGFSVSTAFVEHKNYYRVKINGQDESGRTIHRVVESLGLLGLTSKTKAIPKSYLYSSERSRKALLQGLLDTDGHISVRGNFEFSTVSDHLCEDFIELTRSLGIATHYKYQTRDLDGGSYSNTPIHRITQLKGYDKGLKIVRVQPTGKYTEMQCIKVSNDDHLYITDDFVPTHNTTTAIVLGKALLDETQKITDQYNLNPQVVKQSLEAAAREVDAALLALATPCKNLDLVQAVATISANGDTSIGQVIRSAFDAVGAEGVVTIDEGGSRDHTLDIVNGFQFRRGAEAQDRFFNNETGTKFEAEKVHTLIYDGKLQETQYVTKYLELLFAQYQGKMPAVLFVANDYSPDVLQAMLYFRAHQQLSVCAIKSPHTTTIRTQMLDDIAVFLGGQRLGNGNRNLSGLEFDDIGIAEKVVIDKYTTTFYDGYGEESDILARVDKLTAQRAEAESPYDAALLSDRIAALSQGIAKIGVGGHTDLEVKEKYHRIEDAVNAARAAIEQGIIPGGGATLLRISEVLNGDTMGHRILKQALKAPFRQICSNLGLAASDINNLETKLAQSSDSVYDGLSGKVINAMQAGIIDPVKVTRTALESAISIASLLSTCGGAITYARKK